MKKNGKGFSPIGLLLILVVMGLIGFLGWYVWQAKDETNSAKTNSSRTQTNRQNSVPKTSNYKNTELGISLSYPTEWGGG